MPQVPTICLSGLSETQRRAYILVDNKLALNAGWNPELLRIELGELKLSGFDLALTRPRSLAETHHRGRPLPPVTRRFAPQARSPTAGVAEPIAPGSSSWPEVARGHRHLRAKARHGIGRIHLPSR
jgi:hypothetical protein